MTGPGAMDCGGCRGEGAHKRWCSKVVGLSASVRGNWAERLEGLADEIGSNDPGVANQLYGLSGKFRADALDRAEKFKTGEWR